MALRLQLQPNDAAPASQHYYKLQFVNSNRLMPIQFEQPFFFYLFSSRLESADDVVVLPLQRLSNDFTLSLSLSIIIILYLGQYKIMYFTSYRLPV
jgi:hypothetical protein